MPYDAFEADICETSIDVMKSTLEGLDLYGTGGRVHIFLDVNEPSYHEIHHLQRTGWIIQLVTYREERTSDPLAGAFRVIVPPGITHLPRAASDSHEACDHTNEQRRKQTAGRRRG